VDYESCRQAIASGKLRLAGLATAQEPAFVQEVGPRSAVDSSVHAAPAEQRAVACIYDSVNRQLRNVALVEFQHVVHFLV
jgi:hypothetical protein